MLGASPQTGGEHVLMSTHNMLLWHGETHPASRLQDFGLSLVELELHHPEPARVSRLLQSLGFEGPVTVAPKSAVVARLVAHIETPHGMRTL
jgi:hypothetical protein